jgi:Periplasmic binding protein
MAICCRLARAIAAPNAKRGQAPARSVCLLLAALTAQLLSALPAFAQDTVKIAVIMSQTGPSQTAGVPVIDAVRLATDEANADGETPSVEFAVYDDHSIDDGAREAAKQVTPATPSSRSAPARRLRRSPPGRSLARPAWHPSYPMPTAAVANRARRPFVRYSAHSKWAKHWRAIFAMRLAPRARC